MKDLTSAEEEIMQILWEIEKGFVKDVREKMPEPRPAYNTVSTIIRILEKKGFVDHEAMGKSHLYHPVVPKEKYTKHALGHLIERYFDGSYKSLVSFFMKNEKLSPDELEELAQKIEQSKREES
jgi:predicted transcriptional regulator